MSLLLSHKNSWFNLWFSLLPILLLGRRIAILARWRKAEKAHREADIVFYFMSNHRNNSEHQAAQTRFSSASRSRTNSHDKLHTNRETGKKHQASEEVWLRGHLRVGRWRRSYVRGNVWTYSIWTLPAVATLVTDMPLRITVILQQSVVHAPYVLLTCQAAVTAVFGSCKTSFVVPLAFDLSVWISCTRGVSYFQAES